MSAFKIFLIITATCIFSSTAFGDIYVWTDENGIKHYSNYAPPENSRILMKTKEAPYDEEADRARAEAERQAQLELARLEIAQREAELEQREAEAERRLAEADRLAEEAQRNAESYAEEVGNSRSSFQSYGYGCYDYYNGCSDFPYGRWYYRNENASIFFKKPPYVTPYRHYRYTKRYDGHYGNDYHNNSQLKMYYRTEAHHNTNYPRLRGGNMTATGRIGPRSGSHHGKGGVSGKGPALGWRR